MIVVKVTFEVELASEPKGDEAVEAVAEDMEHALRNAHPLVRHAFILDWEDMGVRA